MKKTAVAVLIAVLSAARAFAAEVSADDAMSAVKGWIKLKDALGGDFSGTPASVAEYEGRDGKGGFYVVSFENGGYVVTSADDELVPVLAYSDEGTFDASPDNPLWCILSAHAACDAEGLSAKQAAAASGMKYSASADAATSNTSKWKRLRNAAAGGPKILQSGKTTSAPSDLRVPELLKSDWSQQALRSGDKCFNLYTPNNYPCGCVATSGAQIMRHFEWPQSSIAAKTITCTVDGTSTNLAMKGGTYDWSNMPADANAKSRTATSANIDKWCKAIGKLTYDLGVSLQMNYKSGGSGARMSSYANVIVSVFGYSNAVFFSAWYAEAGAETMPDSVLRRTIIPNLDAKRPCMIGISNDEGGHAIAADGYGYDGSGELYVHFNMGWRNSYTSNAWYNPPVFDVNSDIYYEILDEIVCNVFTEEAQYSSIASGRVLNGDTGEPLAGATVTAKSGMTTVATATSDERGIYALILPPKTSAATYTVTASLSPFGNSSSHTVTAAQTMGNKASGTSLYLSNSYNGDITLLPAIDTPVVASGAETTLQYGETRTIALSCGTTDATIRYTLDGTEPTEASTAYAGPFALPLTAPGSITLKAKAFKDGYSSTGTLSATYTMLQRVAAPSLNPKSGTVFFTSLFAVSIADGTSGAEIRYTTDGSEPTSSSALYTDAFTLDATCVVKTKAFKNGMSPSETVSAEYVRPALIGTNLAVESSQAAGTSQEIALPIDGAYTVSFGYPAAGALDVLAVQDGTETLLAQVSGSGKAGSTNVTFVAGAGTCELVVRSASGSGTATSALTGITVSIPATEENLKAYWIYETLATLGSTGTWTGDHAVSDGKLHFGGSSRFAPSSAANGRIVEFTITAAGDNAEKSLPVPPAGTKAAISVRRGEDGYRSFALCTSEGGVAKWENVSASGVSVPAAGADFTVHFALDCTNRTYTAEIVSGGEGIPLLTEGGKAVFDFADGGGSASVGGVVFDGSGSMLLMRGSYWEYTALAFDEGQNLALGGDASVTLTALQADWLNSMESYQTVRGKACGMSSAEFDEAYLLNLDLTRDAFGLAAFSVAGVEVSAESVTVRVRLERVGAMVGGEGADAPINGLLKIYGGESPDSKTLLSATSVTGGDFGSGPEAVFTFPRSGGDSTMFFRAAIVAP